MRENRKRLEILLPENHPIWQLPRGYRATYAAAILELAPWLARLEERLARVEKGLAELRVSLEQDVPAKEGMGVFSNVRLNPAEFFGDFG